MSNTIAKVVDTETGEALPPGAQGELCVSGPQVGMQKYHEFYVTITHYLNLLGRSCFMIGAGSEIMILISNFDNRPR